MVLPLAASRTLTGLGPMLQPLPSTSEYSISVRSGSGSPTLIMVISSRRGWWGAKTKTAHDCGPFPVCLQDAAGLDRFGLFDQAGRNPVLGLGNRLALL